MKAVRPVRHLSGLSLFVALIAAACSSDRTLPSLHLLGGAPGDADAELERLHRMQLVRVIQQDGDKTSIVEKSTAELAGDIVTQCSKEVFDLDALDPDFACGPPLALSVVRPLCEANLLLEIMGLRAAPLTLSHTNPTTGTNITYQVLPQSAATNAGLGTVALQAAQSSLQASSILLDYASHHPTAENFGFCDQTDLLLTSGGLSAGAILANTYVEAFHVYHDIVERTADATLAAADAQRANPSLNAAVSRSLAGAELSRAAASHLYVGGDPGLGGSTTAQGRAGVCSVPELSAQAQKAVGVLRQAGPSPLAVLSIPGAPGITEAISIHNFLNGTGSQVLGGSIRQRLSERWGFDFDNPPEGIPAGQTLADYFDLDEQDFADARNYLAAEIRAFSRSISGTLTPPALGAPSGACKDGLGTPILCPAYAGTTREPKPALPVYYEAIARYINVGPFTPEGSPPSFTSAPLADIVDATVSTARAVIGNQEAFVDPTLRDAIMNPLVTMVSGDELQGRFELCAESNPFSGFRVFATVQGFSETDGLLLLPGEDALRCAVEGSNEGADCSSVPQAYAAFTDPGTPGAGYSKAAFAGLSFIGPPATGTRLYLVKPRDATSQARPGNYVALGGFTFIGAPPSGFCLRLGLVPHLQRRVSNILAPNRKWCSTAQVSCADTDFDERMPLEDELSKDQDGIESSWKHYLTLAKQSADEADALGQAYLRSGLEFDQRQETQEMQLNERERVAEDKAIQAIQEVQDICGTTIDPKELLKLLSGNTDGDDLKLVREKVTKKCTGNSDCNASRGFSCTAQLECHDAAGAPEIVDHDQCTTDANCDSNKGYVCLLNHCMIEPGFLASFPKFEGTIGPDLKRLHDCISGSTQFDYVHLGSSTRPLCIWHDTLDKRQICKRADPEHPCPVPATKGNCDMNVPDQNTMTQVPVPIGLDLFDTTKMPGYVRNQNSAPETSCDKIRELRRSPGDTNLFNALAQDVRFHPTEMTALASRVGFEARYGNHAAILLDGSPRFQTGVAWNLERPVAFPCTRPTLPAGCVTGTGLFCTQIDCDDTTARLQMNDRMMRAVLAFGITATPANTSAVNIRENIEPSVLWEHFCRSGDNDDVFCTSLDRGQTSVLEFAIKNQSSVPILEHVQSKVLDNPSEDSRLRPQRRSLNGRLYEAPNVPSGSPARLGYSTVDPKTGQFTHLDVENLPKPAGDYRGRGFLQFEDVAPFTFFGANQDLPTIFWAGLGGSIGSGWFAQALGQKGATRGLDLGFDGHKYSADQVLDGMELACELSRLTTGCDGATMPQITSVADLPHASDFLRCVAERIDKAGSLAVLASFPAAALDPLRTGSSQGSFPANGGTQGVNISQLRSALVEVGKVPTLIAGQLRTMSDNINAVYLAINLAGISKKLADVQVESSLSNSAAACASTMTFSSIMGGEMSLIATCANAFAQEGFAHELNSLNQQKEIIEKNLALNAFSQRFTDSATNLAGLAHRLTQALDQVDEQLAQLELQRSRAKRALARALTTDSFESKFAARINAVMWKRFQTDRIRYEQSFKNAQRMSFLAKRAIEMRLGVKLSELTDELPLVNAPASWESTLCASSGINFTDIQGNASTFQFADAFVGDYVRKLENVVESYRLVNNFHEGTDTAVVSLRDDIQNVRIECDVPVNNLLFHAGNFEEQPTGTVGGWETKGCATQTLADGTQQGIPSCIGISPEQTAPLIPSAIALSSGVKAYTLRFGDGLGCAPTTCGWRAGASLIQKVRLKAGKYRASVFVKDTTNLSDVGLVLTASDVPDTAPDGGPLPEAGPGPATPVTGTAVTIPGTSVRWPRVYMQFELPTEKIVTFGLQRPTAMSGSPPSNIVVAGPMLESLVDVDQDAVGSEPAQFANTTDVRTRRLRQCEDTSGERFRIDGWQPGTDLLCPDGFSGNCVSDKATRFKFWETHFTLNQRDIEAGRMLGNAGFARGNFNYRIESVAVNFVGTGIHDCSDSLLPSTCNSGAFVNYTLTHDGPFFVRNYQGKDFLAELFPGRIENARGLAAERYITNPLSSADKTLLEPYDRFEFQGRPMDGSFTLRIWDGPGLNFNAIKDAQIILNYRYWTRFQ